MSQTTTTYTPTGDELSEAISTFIKEENSETKITTVQMCELLKTENPSWKIQQKRVSRYLKRELKLQKKLSSPTSGKDDVSMYSSASNVSFASIKSKVSSIISLKSKKKDKKKGKFTKKKSTLVEESGKDPTDLVIETGTTTETQTTTNLLPSMEQDDNGVEDNVPVSISDEAVTDQGTLNTEVTSLSLDGDLKDPSTKDLEEPSEQTLIESIPEKEGETAEEITEEVEGMVESDPIPDDMENMETKLEDNAYSDETDEKESEKAFACEGCTIL